jgi:superfamily I DNA and/or RNA helicase
MMLFLIILKVDFKLQPVHHSCGQEKIFFEAVDYLFVDEAGQLSLIDTVALSHAGKNLVLLGDPQQLKQPQKGSHPEGTEVSALEHILQEEKTISPARVCVSG